MSDTYKKDKKQKKGWGNNRRNRRWQRDKLADTSEYHDLDGFDNSGLNIISELYFENLEIEGVSFCLQEKTKKLLRYGLNIPVEDI